MICKACGHINPEPRDICERCYRPMGASASPPRLNARLQELKTTVDSLLKGQMTTGEFQNFMEDTEDFLLIKLEEVKNFEIPSDMKEEMRQEMQVGILGIETYITSIDLFLRYIKDRDSYYIEEGMKTAQKATDLLNTALCLNWKSYDSFRESTEEYLRSTGLNTN
jgi:hypothetical protein